MLGHGFTVAQMVEPRTRGLATATAERMVAGGRTLEVARRRSPGGRLQEGKPEDICLLWSLTVNPADKLATLSPQFLMNVVEDVIEICDSNQAESWKFHVRNNVERGRKSGGKRHHVYPAARLGCGHAKAGK